MRFKAVIFDMDGVLADTEPFYQEIERSLFKRLGLDIGQEEHETFKGVATDRMWEILKPKYRMHQSVEELMQITTDEVIPFFQSLDRILPFEGVTELIRKLSANGIPLALASSSYPEVIRIVLEKSGLKSFFSVVVNSEMAGASKPDPAIFLLAARELGVKPADCLVIEDSTNGIAAAKSAGMCCVAVDFPENKLQVKNQADFLITSFSLLSGMLDFGATDNETFTLQIN